jgi:OOP family OmpA-OmpF porin
MSRYLAPAALAVLVLASTAPASHARDNRDVVQDAKGRVVLNTFGNCVRTDWVGTNNTCHGQQRVVEAPKPQKVVYTSPARNLETEARTVYFEFNKSRITPEEQAKLDSLADVLKSDQTVQNASIVGYADRIGSAKYNEQLSKKRAQAVESYLNKRGYVNTSVAKVRWLGESAPVTDCSNKLPRKKLIACLHKDRRVEVEVNFYPVTDTSVDTKPHKTMDHSTTAQ